MASKRLNAAASLGIGTAWTQRFAISLPIVGPMWHWSGAAAFNRGRAGILGRFLERPAIYSTEHFKAKYEEQARANLRRSIRRLEEVAWTEADG